MYLQNTSNVLVETFANLYTNDKRLYSIHFIYLLFLFAGYLIANNYHGKLLTREQSEYLFAIHFFVIKSGITLFDHLFLSREMSSVDGYLSNLQLPFRIDNKCVPYFPQNDYLLSLASVFI